MTVRRSKPLCKAVFLLVSAILILANSSETAFAHGGRVPLAEWGPFDAGTALCQRVLLAATESCARTAWLLRRRCRAAQLEGGSCDEAGTDARIVGVRRDALDRIDLHCSERQLGLLGFLGQFDMQTDVIGACRSWEDLMESAVYGNAAASSLGCIRTADRVLTRSTVVLFDRWRRSLRRMASREMTPEQKESRVVREEERRDAMAARAGDLLAEACGAAEAVRLRRVVELAVCPPARISVQERVICPDPICGNGLLEPGETEDACGL